MSEISENLKKIAELEMQKDEKRDLKDRTKIYIKETVYLGKIDGEDIYRITKQDDRENSTSTLYKYYNGELEVVGVKNEGFHGDKKWLDGVRDGEQWDKMKDEIDKNEAELEEEIEQIYGELDLSKDEIENITEVDLEQKMAEKDNEKNLVDEEQEKEPGDRENYNSEKEKEEEKKESVERTEAYSNTLQEVDTNKRIDQKGTTLGKALDIDNYSKILVIHADNVKDVKDANGNRSQNSTKQIALLGVTNVNGKQVVEKIPEDKLQYYRGSNEQSIRFTDDETVEKNNQTTERFVNPNTQKGLAIERTGMETKVFYQGGVDRSDNTGVMLRVEDTHTGNMGVEAETKELFNSNHGIYQKEKINDEMERHEEEDKGEEIARENSDGDLNTVSDHIHEIDASSEIVYKGQLMSVSEVAQMSEFKMSPEHFVELYNKNCKKFEGQDEIDMDDLYEEIEQDVNDEIVQAHSR